MSNNIQRRQAVEAALQSFANAPLPKASAKLLNSLGYASEKTTDLGGNVESLLGNIEKFKPELGIIRRDKVKADRWKSCAFLFQLTNDEITSLAVGQTSLGVDNKVARSQIESFVFLAIELQGESWSRTDLAAIVRELNRRFPMPAIVIFRHGELLSLAVIDRRANLKDSAKDVIDSRITVIKDVWIANPHRAHLDILAGLALENLGDKRRPANFRELYDAWIEALSTQALNKRFYQELANWYFWALTQAQFPKDAPKDADGRDSLSLIRLITRIIFCWFLKEKGLLPDALFDPRKIATLLGDYNPLESNFYKAILQNLFFATLNQEMDKRVFRKAGQNFMAHNLYRYRGLMKNPDEVLKLLAGIPFMNGGLFECLDKTLGTKEKPVYVRIDGFSDRDDNPLKIPNELFFSEERTVDLSDAFGDNKFKSAKVTGLIHILDRYKFTVAENTPIEEEVALDPELLGKAFENLLAAYNPETGATARKQTGSFYTPREIVNYMVDESLIASLKNKLTTTCPDAANTEERLRHLFAYTDQPHQFTAAEVESLIEAIDHLKILDPACGSGAFPMGVLHKLVFVLGKLDPGNKFWKARQLAKVDDAAAREQAEKVFGENYEDYGRKLYLIENCIYGVDIQPIAVQISKLRFFISLVVEQKINPQADNQGIRPLPNLETKFVDANTLIGINRPGQQLLRNLDIDVKEAELRNVRERHFLARTPATKAKCREQDATLRAVIAELLKNDGWGTATAKKLASWDPYDQNASADFFDVEWMFGLTTGFDVAIGNPPYGADLSTAEREHLSEKFPFVPDKESSNYFICVALGALRESGRKCFIIPNTWLVNRFAKKLRKHFLETCRIDFIIDCSGFTVFEAASVRNSITMFSKCLPLQNHMVKFAVFHPEKGCEESRVVNSTSLFSGMDNWLTFFSTADSKLSLVEKLRLGSMPLSSFSRSSQGLIPYDKYRGHDEHTIKNRIWHADFQKDETYKKELQGKDIDRYQVAWNGNTWISYGDWLAAPRKPEFFRAKRILIREITNPRILAAYTEDEYYNTPSIINVIDFHGIDPYYLLGLLNSRLLSFYHIETSPKSKKGLFPKILVNDVRMLPIKIGDSQAQESIVSLVKKVIELQKEDTAALKNKIDLLVYCIYGLTYEEVKLVEESVP